MKHSPSSGDPTKSFGYIISSNIKPNAKLNAKFNSLVAQFPNLRWLLREHVPNCLAALIELVKLLHPFSSASDAFNGELLLLLPGLQLN